MHKRSFAAIALACSLAACGGGSSGSSTQSAADQGSISAAGSTALLPLMKQAVADYSVAHPDAKISVSGGGSSVGITQVSQKGVDIGDSDIPATGVGGLVDHEVAVVSFAVIANPSAGVRSLTKAQIAGIFTGKITNFKAVGGKDQTINVINRPRGSGTRAVFSKVLLDGAQPSEGGGTQDSSGTVATIIAQVPGGISYVATSYVKSSPGMVVEIDGVAPTDANVTGGKYPFWSYEHLFTNGAPTKRIADFIAYVSSDKAALAALGFIPVSAMKK